MEENNSVEISTTDEVMSPSGDRGANWKAGVSFLVFHDMIVLLYTIMVFWG
jgi:hypothetical protein